jgi:hypothetical protein
MTADHESWDELLAGHALHALEQDDERRLEQHAVDCDTCQSQLADFEAVAADLGRALPPVPPPSGGKERLRAALASAERPTQAARTTAIASQRVSAGPAGPPPRRDRNRPGDGRARRVSRALVAGMAAITLLAAGAIGYGLHQRHVASDRASKLATAEQLLRGIATGQRTVVMQSSGDARGRVVQSDEHIWLVADGLAPNNPSSSVYVLWATTPQGEMSAVATFDVGKDGVAIVNRAALPDDAAAVPAFAVSHEEGRTAPARPSTPLLRSQA